METVQVTPLGRTLVSSPYSKYTSCYYQGQVGSKTAPTKSSNSELWMAANEVVLYNGHKSGSLAEARCWSAVQ